MTEIRVMALTQDPAALKSEVNLTAELVGWKDHVTVLLNGGHPEICEINCAFHNDLDDPETLCHFYVFDYANEACFMGNVFPGVAKRPVPATTGDVPNATLPLKTSEYYWNSKQFK